MGTNIDPTNPVQKRNSGLRPRSRVAASPAELRLCTVLSRELETWFVFNGRQFTWRSWRDTYRVALTEVLLQRTRASAVDQFLPRFLNRFPTWHSISNASHSEVAEHLEDRSVLVHVAPRRLAFASYSLAGDGRLSAEAPGIGQYIDRAIRVTQRADRVAMIDSNWVRILRRVFRGPWLADYRYDPKLQALGAEIVLGTRDPRTVNWAALDLGAAVCKPRAPACNSCPLISHCAYGATRLAPNAPNALDHPLGDASRKAGWIN